MEKKTKNMPEYVDIQITNFQLHTAEPRKPQSIGRVVERSIRSKQEQRAYTTDIQEGQNNLRFTFRNVELERIVAKAKAEGKTVRFFVPKGGIPVLLGNDTVEFLKGKRWAEHLAKEISP